MGHGGKNERCGGREVLLLFSPSLGREERGGRREEKRNRRAWGVFFCRPSAGWPCRVLLLGPRPTEVERLKAMLNTGTPVCRLGHFFFGLCVRPPGRVACGVRRPSLVSLSLSLFLWDRRTVPYRTYHTGDGCNADRPASPPRVLALFGLSRVAACRRSLKKSVRRVYGAFCPYRTERERERAVLIVWVRGAACRRRTTLPIVEKSPV